MMGNGTTVVYIFPRWFKLLQSRLANIFDGSNNVLLLVIITTTVCNCLCTFLGIMKREYRTNGIIHLSVNSKSYIILLNRSKYM